MLQSPLQISLLKDYEADRKAALEADINAAGGQAAVGIALQLSDDPKTAATLLNNKLNENGRHRLSAREEWQIKQIARQHSGRSRLVEYECGELRADLHWVTEEEFIERKERLLESKLTEILNDLHEVRAARRRKAEVSK